jgi:predicted DNA-binding antitoxin AbrB/MazE fold protein
LLTSTTSIRGGVHELTNRSTTTLAVLAGGRARPRGTITAKEITMSIAVDAVWEKGVLTPKTRLDLPEKTSVKLIVELPTKSTLGADLRALRARIVASGIPLLDDDEVLAEVHASRGGYDHEDAANQ